MGRTRFITINLTNRCNLSCVYCYEHNKDGDTISIDIAKQIIEQEIEAINRSDYDTLSIELFGGEPFLEFDLIREITDYLHTIECEKSIEVLITTNGTLVHGQIQDWLLNNRDLVQCCLSLDGDKAMHDINRCNSFEDIDLAFFARAFPDCPVKMTITPETISRLSDGIIFCHEQGLKVGGNLAYGARWSADHKDILKQQLELLSGYYYSHPNVEPCELLCKPIKTNERNGYCHKNCGVGTHTHSYDTAGNRYPCQFFMPISIGAERANVMKSFVFDERIPNSLINESCRDCIYEPSCFNCYGSNFQQTGNVYQRDLSMCELVKTIIDARCEFIANSWDEGRHYFSRDIELETLRSILQIARERQNHRAE